MADHDGVGLPSQLARRLAGFAALPDVLVSLDFDGTLAPLVAVPARARMPQPTREAFEALVAARPGRVALVSGRALADLVAVADPPAGVILVGSHGAEVDGAPPALDVPAIRRLARLADAVEAVVARRPGTSLERKPAGVVLHTRRAAPDVAARAQADLLARVADLEGPEPSRAVRITRGKQVVELSVLDVDKGRALQRLRRELGVSAVLYAGDDVTDEHAFEVLDDATGDVAIKVGDGDTAARWRLPGPEAMPALLRALH